MMTFTELLIGITIFVLLGFIMLPLISDRILPTHAHAMLQVSKMKQLHFATQQMARDYTATGDTNLPEWTCRGTNPITYREWTNLLVGENYLTATDLKKLLRVSYTKDSWLGRKTVVITNAVVVFAVTKEDPDSTLFLASCNWLGLAALGLTPSKNPTNGFTVFRKGGDGAILPPHRFKATNLIGTGGMHNFLPLR